jgi:hypothetical protein
MCAECENYLLGGACLPACPPGYYPAISRTLGETFVFREKKKQIITGMFRDMLLVSYFLIQISKKIVKNWFRETIWRTFQTLEKFLAVLLL